MKLTEILNGFEGDVVFEGNGHAVHCPAHQDSKPSLRVAVSKDSGNALLKCRAGCLTADVVAASKHIEFPDLFDVDVDVEGHIGVVKSDQPVNEVLQATMALYLVEANGNVSGPAGRAAMEYAERRFGVDRDTFWALGLGYDSGDDFPASFLGPRYTDVPRLVVPFRDHEGVPRGFQARDISAAQSAVAKWSGPSNPPEGGSWTRTAYFKAGSGMDYVVVTEGPGDGLTVVGAGIDSVGIRGVSHASAVVEELSETLKGRRVILAGDADRAGQGMNVRLGTALSAAGLDVHVLGLPDGVEDLSDWFEKHPESFTADFQRAVSTAEPFRVEEPAGPTVSSVADGDLDTHVGAARRVVELFDHGVRYAEGLGYMVYSDGVWSRDSKGLSVRSKIHEIGEDLLTEADALDAAGQANADAVRTIANRLRKTYFIDSVMKELMAMVPVDAEAFDNNHGVIVFDNVAVNLKTGETLPHDKGIMNTSKLSVAYDAEAECPRWLDFLNEVMPDNEAMPSFLQRLTGYGITGYTSEQCFAVLWGTGANGKSIFTDTLSYVFDAVTTTTPFSTFEEKQSGGIPNDLAALRGSRLVFASEGDRGKPMAEAVIKRVTGQDVITARFMREEFFSFRPSFLILMGTNYKPNFKGQDEGLWRRVKLVPFKRYFAPDERDHYLADKLRGEAEGIAAWAVRGAVEWHKKGLADPESVTAATRNYRDTADALSGFFPDGPLVKGAATDFVLGSDVYKLYEKWCDDEELSIKERWSRRALYGALEERGLDKVKRNVGICLMGCKLASTETSELRDTVMEQSKATIFDGAR